MEKEFSQILSEDKEAIKNLTSLTQQEYLAAISQIQDLPISPAEKSKMLKSVSAEIAFPFFALNEQLSVQLYEENRAADIGSELGFDLDSSKGLSQESFSKYMAQASWAVNEDEAKAWEDSLAFDALLLLIGGALTKGFLTARSENYGKIGNRDSRYSGQKRIPSRNACAFCLMAAVENDGSDRRFHRFCRCGVGIAFDGSPDDKYSTSVLDQFAVDLAAAKIAGTDGNVLSTLRTSFGYR